MTELRRGESGTPIICKLARFGRCELEVPQSTRGGRPAEFCSSAHRSEYHRLERKQSGNTAGESLDPVVSQLEQALEAVRAYQERTAALDPAAMAETRAEATKEVLAAQQDAAAARRALATANAEFQMERTEWADERARAEDERSVLSYRLDEAQEALRALRRHVDNAATAHEEQVHQLEKDAAAAVAEHARDLEEHARLLRSAQATAAEAAARAESAERRAAVAENNLVDFAERARELEVRLGSAEATAKEAVTRADFATEQLEAARADLTAERARADETVRDLRQRLATVRKPTAARARAARQTLPARRGKRST